MRDDAMRRFTAARASHWSELAEHRREKTVFSRAYEERVTSVYRLHVPEGRRILEIGCSTGDLLSSLKPAFGVGMDLVPEQIARARRRHPSLTFVVGDGLDLHEALREANLDGERFDFVILNDLVNDVWDVQELFEHIRDVVSPDGRVILNAVNGFWEWLLRAVRKLGLATPTLEQNWLTPRDVQNLLELAGFELVRLSSEVLLPAPLPGLRGICDRWLVKFWPLRYLAFTSFFVARRARQAMGAGDAGSGGDVAAPGQPSVSVVVAARNEEGNIRSILDRLPDFGGRQELIFVEGGSSDDTYGEIERAIADQPGRDIRLFRQPGKGKGDAVRTGFSNATGDVLMILDADMTVPPEHLPRFYDVIASGEGEFINGVRLVYPMEDHAMRAANLLGNKAFSLAFSWLLGQSIRDTLCGTKVISRSNYERLSANRSYFGDFDPFGDFDLLLGAAKMNLKITEVPVRYRSRTYGSTNIQRWRAGWLLLRMTAFAARKLKFV